MSGAFKGKAFFDGFFSATIALGALIVIAWTGLWLTQALGGPDWRMPVRLLMSGGTLIVLGYLLKTFATGRQA